MPSPREGWKDRGRDDELHASGIGLRKRDLFMYAPCHSRGLANQGSLGPATPEEDEVAKRCKESAQTCQEGK